MLSNDRLYTKKQYRRYHTSLKLLQLDDKEEEKENQKNRLFILLL